MELEEVSRPLEIGLTARAEQAVGADLGEAAREHVLEKSCKEGVHGKRDTPRFT